MSNWNRRDTGRTRRLWLLKSAAEVAERVRYTCYHPGCAQIATTSGLRGESFVLLCPDHALSAEEHELLVSGLVRSYEHDMGRGEEGR